MGWFKKAKKKLKKELSSAASDFSMLSTGIPLDKVEGVVKDATGQTAADAARSQQRQQRSLINRQRRAEESRLAEEEDELSRRRLRAARGGRRSLLGG